MKSHAGMIGSGDVPDDWLGTVERIIKRVGPA